MKDSIQEQLAIARKNQILDSAARVFATKGFHPTTIRDIAKDAGIADGTIYLYFKSKTALLLGIFERMQAAALENAPQEFSANLELGDFVELFLRQPLSQFKADNFELFRVIVSEMLVNEELRGLYYQQILSPTIALAEAQLQVWAERGLIKGENIPLTVRALTGMVMGLMLENIMADPVLERHWDELPAFLSQLVLKGIQE